MSACAYARRRASPPSLQSLYTRGGLTGGHAEAPAPPFWLGADLRFSQEAARPLWRRTTVYGEPLPPPPASRDLGVLGARVSVAFHERSHSVRYPIFTLPRLSVFIAASVCFNNTTINSVQFSVLYIPNSGFKDPALGSTLA